MSAKAIPLLAKEGKTRHQTNAAKPHFWSGRGGRSHETFQSRRIRALFLSLIFIQNPDSILNQIGIDQKLGAQIDPAIQFVDESGKAVTLGNYFGTKPILLTPVYYECPMLCSMLLNGLVQAMHVMPLTAGKDFEIITFSFDPHEQQNLAAQKKQHYVRDYGRPPAAEGWHFLTGAEESIRKLTDEIGFRYKFDAATGQWAHTSGIVLLTPTGIVSKYFNGIEYDPKDLKLGIIEASDGKVGSFVDSVALYCFQYNPATGKYSIAIMRLLRTAAVATVLLIVTYMLLSSRRRRLA